MISQEPTKETRAGNGSEESRETHRPSGSEGLSANGHEPRPVVITGGAGFIGTNLAHRLACNNQRIIIFDNLSRRGVERNLEWLRETHGEKVQHFHGDVRDPEALREALRDAIQVFHFAAQVAVTTSLANPVEDFEINARGTLNLLEVLRSLRHPPSLVFTSTNKVYGDLSDVTLRLRGGRYEPEAPSVRRHGFAETRPLHFHSPYGCSKGAACQYVQDYARTFGVPAVVFRMSCIYGPHQFGTEDQGWVAHFLIRAREGRAITVYGDGCQVRDILFVDDLVNALLLAQERIKELSGRVFNIGGGPENTISLRELLNTIESLHGKRPKCRLAKWRAADQRYYVSDTRSFRAQTNWSPRVGVQEGIRRLDEWLRETSGTSAKAMEAQEMLETQRAMLNAAGVSGWNAGLGGETRLRLRGARRQGLRGVRNGVTQKSA